MGLVYSRDLGQLLYHRIASVTDKESSNNGSEDEIPVICSCGQPKNAEQIIGCDKPRCPTEWHQFEDLHGYFCVSTL